MFAKAEDMFARPGMEKDVLVQLTDQAEWNGPALAAVNTALFDASAIAEGYVATYYAPAPNRAVPPMLIGIVCDLAFAKLHRAPTDDVKDRRDTAMKLLKDISTGLIKLDQGKQDMPARSGAVIVPDRERTFSRDRLKGF